MGLHDIETMNAAAAALRKIKPDVLLYGEGWDMYRGTGMVGATQLEARKLDRIGFFNDALRCGIKGSIFGAHAGGFIHDGSRREAVKFGLVGAVYHPCVHNSLVDGTANPNPWTDVTASSVNYTEIHDNTTLYDKLVLVEDGKDAAYYARMQRTAIALVLFAQGMPVLHAGMEFMRTKEIPSDLLASNPGLTDVYRSTDGKRAFSHNSYNLYDRINGLDWHRCADNRDTVEYVRQLIAVRKAHPLFRLRTASLKAGRPFPRSSRRRLLQRLLTRRFWPGRLTEPVRSTAGKASVSSSIPLRSRLNFRCRSVRKGCAGI